MSTENNLTLPLHQTIPVIDIFAGPGGLGEGFSSVADPRTASGRRFSVVLSVEKDAYAYQTLLLRTFLRQFPLGQFPDDYYAFLERRLKTTDELYKLYPREFDSARQQAWQAILVKEKRKEKKKEIIIWGVSSAEVDARIRSAVNGAADWALIGGPPCQAYSIVGRARMKGVIDPEDPRVYLYREYYRILAVHRPTVFVMENVKGLLSSKVNKEFIFTQIIRDLENPASAYEALEGSMIQQEEHPGYQLFSLVMPPRTDGLFQMQEFKQKDFLIESENFGVPQKRHRLILLGIRNDLAAGLKVQLLTPQEKTVSVRDVIGNLPAVRSQLSGRRGEERDSEENWLTAVREGAALASLWEGADEQTINLLNTVVRELKIPDNNNGKNFIADYTPPEYNPNGWYSDKKLKGTCQHETRYHIRKDILRYLFSACYTKVHGRFPHLSDFPSALLPAHKNVEEAIEEGKFSDRFCVQKWDEPSRTITSHISKDGHYYIHPDPAQCRSFTVREASRIQTFPDNYFFCGPRTAQYHQVGNAVPPYLAFQIAKIVDDVFNQISIQRILGQFKAEVVKKN